MAAVSCLPDVVTSGRGRRSMRETTQTGSGRLPMRAKPVEPTIVLSKERSEIMFDTIVWATDGSEFADNALEHVRKLAEIHGSRIVVVHGNELLTGRFGGTPVRADEPDVREKLKRQVEELGGAGFDATLEIRTGGQHVATLVELAADEVDADLIVVGTHGRTGVTAAVMGSVARALCHVSRRPVLVVPPVRRAEPSTDGAGRLTTA
jgi:nucleotide-binding universal stress UspA family protein